MSDSRSTVAERGAVPPRPLPLGRLVICATMIAAAMPRASEVRSVEAAIVLPDSAVAFPRAPRPDPQPRVTAALLQLFRGADEAHGAIRTTPAFQLLELPRFAKLPDVEALRFLECAAPSSGTPASALGTPVDRVCSYRLEAAAGPPTLMVFLTPSDEVAGVTGW